MHFFSTYTAELEKYTGAVLAAPIGSFKEEDIGVSLFCTQQVEKHLRELIPIEELRDAGSFFTGDVMAEDAVAYFAGSISKNSMILDPTCGAGNLLIACSKKLPVNRSSLIKTLTLWGRCLAGFDLVPEFVEATKLRLILAAISRKVCPDLRNLAEAKALLFNIRDANAFDHKATFAKATHIIINPPYYKMKAGESCGWADGKINAAAKFMAFIAIHAQNEAHVSAILPDVLRSGTRYEKWRNLISSKLDCSICSAGRFDSKTDVDVFLLRGQIAAPINALNWLGVNYSAKTVADYFDITIGPVVPYRDKKKGPTSPYIHPKILPLWAEIKDSDIEETWEYSGTLKLPPFVAIRRTSSPSDLYRAGATLIKGTQKIAVENHLIVARPKSGTIKDSKKLLNVLKDKRTNDFLNQRIRCRHLTVTAVKEIPWIGEKI